MMRSLGLFVAGTAITWMIIVVPARMLWGDSAVWFSGVSALLCLVPTALTLLWGRWSLRGVPEQQLLAVFGGMGLRMVVVVGVGLALFCLHPAFHYLRFLLWVIAFYLITLTLEMGILLYGSSPAGQPHHVSRIGKS